MEGKDNISEELRLISEFVAAISRSAPYALPDGYFESLAGKVLDRVRTGETAGLPTGKLDSTGTQDAVPTEAGLPELLGSGSPQPAYFVPEGYFEGFAEKLMNRIKTSSPFLDKTGTGDEGIFFGPDHSPILSKVGKDMPYRVPEGYFKELPAALATAAMAGLSRETAGTEDLSSLLASLKNRPVYQAPEGYFTRLPDTILGKIKQQIAGKEEVSGKEEAYGKQLASGKQSVSGKQLAPAKIFSLGLKSSIGLRRNVWKYAAAAVMTGLILTGSWLKLHTPAATGGPDIATSLPKVSDQEIESYLDTNNVTHNVPLTEDLGNSTASLDLSDNDINSFLGDVPDGELKQYIDEHGDRDFATN